jgi:RimJ/RimL family protein N-acetyltransferase
VPPTATAAGLLLRPWAERDIPAMVAAYRDQEMRRWLRSPVTNPEQARERIQTRQADWRSGRAFSFAVLEIDADGVTGDLAGSVTVRGLGGPAASGEVGYWVAAPARGRGIAPRALSVLCEWVFALPRRLERLELIHAVGNLASCRVADKAGFSLAAVLPPLRPDFPDDGHLHIRRVSPTP